MEKPVIFAVDDEPAVLSAVSRDLRRHYGDRFRTLRAESGAAALEAVQQLKLRNDPVALFLVDQRMPGMSGVEFLEQALQYYPDAKRALLTAYADTDAAIRAINSVRLDYYLMKPWDPPEEHLYPILDDLLDDWQASFQPPFEGLRVIGHRWSPDRHRIREFLARNQVPSQWLDVEVDEEAKTISAQLGTTARDLPLVVFPDGSYLSRPSNVELAGKVGLHTRPELPFYDLIIVGAGPAGLAAAVYGASEGLNTMLIEREAAGGQAGMSSRIENYLGFPAGLSGSDLARRAVAQATRFGAELLTTLEACGVRVDQTYRIVQLSDGSEVGCHALLIATGVSYRRLDVPGIDRLTGAGVYYGGALAEAMTTKGEDVFIVGGANSAGQAAMYFSKFARTVTMLVRSGSLSSSMSQYLIDQIEATENIHLQTRTEVVGVVGENRLEGLDLKNADTGEVTHVPATSLFIFIGAQPQTDWIAGLVAMDPGNYILTGPDMKRLAKPPFTWPLAREPFLLETSVPGIFVAGDVRHRSMKRIASAVGEGAMAVSFIHQYLGML